MKTLAELQALCKTLQITVDTSRRGKEPYIEELRKHFWQRDFGATRVSSQETPMLLSDWDEQVDVSEMERDGSDWVVQPKLDGVRALLHISRDGVRITGRNMSEANFRLTEHQANLPHLCEGLEQLEGSILDGEIVCPVSNVDTEQVTTSAPLQAAVAVLAASPDKAVRIQKASQCQLQFHCFDILECEFESTREWKLRDRIDLLKHVLDEVKHPHIYLVPTIMSAKKEFHDSLIASGCEGSVWKHLDMTYESGRRVKHWVKRKRSLEIEALVSGFKFGSADGGNRNLIGALEFSARDVDGNHRSIGWACNWTDIERRSMTLLGSDGSPGLNPLYLSRRALISGQDIAGRSQRLRHAKLLKWYDDPSESNSEGNDERAASRSLAP